MPECKKILFVLDISDLLNGVSLKKSLVIAVACHWCSLQISKIASQLCHLLDRRLHIRDLSVQEISGSRMFSPCISSAKVVAGLRRKQFLVPEVFIWSNQITSPIYRIILIRVGWWRCYVGHHNNLHFALMLESVITSDQTVNLSMIFHELV